MASVNKAILLGNLGRDPEIRYTTDGTPVANFSIATTRKWKDSNGQQQEHTEWHNIVAWKRLAEICQNYLRKGSQVYIEGEIRTREWSDRDGNKRRSTEINAKELVMVGGRAQTENTGTSGTTGSSESDEPFVDSGITDDDIPF